MALQTSGAISLNDIHIEAGGTTGTLASINDADIRALIGKSAGVQMSFSEWYGASGRATVNITISSNTNNYNIYSNRGGSYVAGSTDVTVTINSGVSIGSTSTGTYALDTGVGWTSGDTITVVNNGTVKGRGGDGGAGASVVYGSQPANGSAGNTGGPAFRAQFATTFTNNGSVYGGGGGGGGAGAAYGDLTIGKSTTSNAYGGGGGGGGAGVNGGSGGSGGTASGAPGSNVNGTAGSSGTATAGGSGGTGGGIANNNGVGGGLGSDGGTGTTGVGILANGDGSVGGAGGTRGFYEVGASFINSGSGIGGTVGGRSS